jgi:hypothetical protein
MQRLVQLLIKFQVFEGSAMFQNESQIFGYLKDSTSDEGQNLLKFKDVVIIFRERVLYIKIC